MNWLRPTLLLPLLLGPQGYPGFQGLKLKRDTVETQTAKPDVKKRVCGQPVDSGRIVGGQDSSIKRWPWQASLIYKNYPRCGGSLVHPKWVLTAAHCLYKRREARFWKILLGSTSLIPSLLSFNRFRIYSVTKIVIHPHYYGMPPKDIALAKLKSSVRFKENIQPICLPPSRTFFENVTMCWVTGWGETEEDISEDGSKALKKPWILQEVQVPLIDQKTCNNYYEKAKPYIRFPLVFDDMICAGFSYGKKDTCQGDSGGPLVCKVNGTWHQAGIVSWGVGCGRPSLPGVYTNVSIHTKWIQNVINSKSSAQFPAGVLLFLLLPLLLH